MFVTIMVNQIVSDLNLLNLSNLLDGNFYVNIDNHSNECLFRLIYEFIHVILCNYSCYHSMNPTAICMITLNNELYISIISIYVTFLPNGDM